MRFLVFQKGDNIQAQSDISRGPERGKPGADFTFLGSAVPGLPPFQSPVRYYSLRNLIRMG